MCLVGWPLNESEAGGDLILIETSLLFLFKLLLISMRTASLTYEKRWGFYQNKVTSNLTFTQGTDNEACSCKMVYYLQRSSSWYCRFPQYLNAARNILGLNGECDDQKLPTETVMIIDIHSSPQFNAWNLCTTITHIFNNYSLSLNGLWVNSYWLIGYESERNNCFSKIQLVGQKNIETKYYSQVKAGHQSFFVAKTLQISLLVGYNI